MMEAGYNNSSVVIQRLEIFEFQPKDEMAHLEDMTADDLRQQQAEINDKTAAERLMLALNYKCHI